MVRSMIHIATVDGWQIFDRPGAARGGWRSIVIRAPFRPSRKTGRKANFWIGWNGERVSTNADARRLEKHGEVFKRVVETLREGFH